MTSLRRRAGVVAVALAVTGLAPACSSDEAADSTTSVARPIDQGSAPVRLELIDDAMAALETSLGGPQQFFEVNASPTVVNLFVATENATQAVAYVFAAGALQPAAEPVPASGPTFPSDAVGFDPELVMAQVVAQLPTSDFRLFTITGSETGAVQYKVVIDAPGAELVVSVSSTGAILGTEQNAVGAGS